MSVTWHTTSSVALECNCMSSTRLQLCGVYQGENDCMSTTRHANANVTPDYNIVVFVGEERAVVCLSLGVQLQVSPQSAIACLQRDCNSAVLCWFKCRPQLQLQL